MTSQESGPVARPTVVADEESAAFFEGTAQGELRLPRCSECGTWQNLGAISCFDCGGEDLKWEAASGRGTVHTFAIMHQLYHPGFADEVPYNLTVVELEEGPRLQTNLVDCPNDAITVGMPVTVIFADAGEARVPKFRPA